MAPLFTVLGLVPFAVPPVTAAAFTWAWSASLARPWLFASFATVVLYVILGTLVVVQFWTIGITGVGGPAPSFFESFVGQLTTVLIAYLALATLALWALRFVLSRL